jgi:uncharacterized protein
MKTINYQTVLITGATSGFGYEFAKIFASNGYDCVIVARNKKNLKTVADELTASYNVTVTSLSKDLSNPKSPFEIFQELKRRKIFIDILINNAGFGIFGSFHKTDIEDEYELITLNTLAPAMMMKLFLPGMIKKNAGKILNIGSLTSFQPCPYMANYCASKSYILALSESVASELSTTNITISTLCPGVVITGFQTRANCRKAGFIQGTHMDAASVARIGYRGLMKGKVVIIPDWSSKIQSKLSRFLPRSLVRFIVRKMMEK